MAPQRLGPFPCQASADLQKMSGTSAQRLQPSIASMVGSLVVQGQGADSYVFHAPSIWMIYLVGDVF
jgi:hypothetical protein